MMKCNSLKVGLFGFIIFSGGYKGLRAAKWRLGGSNWMMLQAHADAAVLQFNRKPVIITCTYQSRHGCKYKAERQKDKLAPGVNKAGFCGFLI